MAVAFGEAVFEASDKTGSVIDSFPSRSLVDTCIVLTVENDWMSGQGIFVITFFALSTVTVLDVAVKDRTGFMCSVVVLIKQRSRSFTDGTDEIG